MISSVPRVFKYAIPLSLFVLAGCGGGGGGSNDPNPEVINRPPSITIISPTTDPVSLNVTQSKTLAIKAKVNDPDGGQVDLVATWSGGSVSPSSVKVNVGAETTMTFTAPKYNGQCTVTLAANDGQASDAETIRINVSGVVEDPSTILRIMDIDASPETVSPGGTAAITAVVSNPGGKALTYKWTTISGRIIGSTNTAQWVAPNTPGIFGTYLQVSDGTETVKSGIPVIVSSGNGGLLGEYYRTKRESNVVSLETKVFSRIDPAINFNWMGLSPDVSKLPSDGFGVRWTGFIKGEVSGTYVLRVHVDDGARMRVMDDDGKWINIIPDNPTNWIDHDNGAWLPNPVVPIELQGGKWYPIDLQYFEGGENAFIRLYWSINGGPEVIIPQSMLKPPSD
ncbi:MAG: PA14 domain-containing protein [Armatimonadota bacterium]